MKEKRISGKIKSKQEQNLTSVSSHPEDTQDRESFQKEEEKIVIKPACLKKPWHWKASVAEARALWQNKEVQREQSEQVPGGERKERAKREKAAGMATGGKAT